MTDDVAAPAAEGPGDMRTRLAGILPFCTAAVVAGYRGFMGRDVPGEAKEFQAYHAACKAALGHLDLLLRLSRWVEAGEAAVAREEKAGEENVHRLLAEAREALADMDDGVPDEDDDGSTP